MGARRQDNPPEIGLIVRWSAGFSLIELTVVVAILAIVAAIAVPRYARALHRYHASVTAQRIVTDLALVQASARATSRTQTITFDIDANSYRLPAESSFAGLQQGYTVDLSREPYRATLLAASFGGSRAVSFNGYGIPSSGGSTVVRAGDTQYTIALNAETGTASIQ